MQTPILLPLSHWQAYTQFYLLWRQTGGVGVSTAICEANGIQRGALGRLRALGVLDYGAHVGLWWPVAGVQVAVMVEDGPGDVATPGPKQRRERHLSFKADAVHLQLTAEESMGERVVEAAKRDGVTVSVWLRDAVKRKLEAEG